VQAGHRESSFWITQTGELDRLAIEDADLNQFASNTMESKEIWASRESIVIQGAIIDLATAEKYARDPAFPLLTPDMVRAAKRHPGWERPADMDPEYAKTKFMREMLDVIAANPNHPLRPLIEPVK
jgi:Bacterial toxin 5